MIQTIRHETRIAVILPAAHRVAFQAVGDRRSHAGDTAGTGPASENGLAAMLCVSCIGPSARPG